MIIREFCKQRDTEFFINTYNSCTKYAPFSVPLDTAKLHKYVLKNVDNTNEFIYICNSGDFKGIIHFGLNPDRKSEGNIYLLLAEKSSIARKLLEHAQNVLVRLGAVYIKCFPWRPYPYEFILYGAESFCWAGLYAANNAFRQLSYDIDLDIVVMSLDMSEKPADAGFNDSGLTVQELPVRDDELVASGQYIACYNGIKVGRSGYYHLKAISEHFAKGHGQIDIWIDEEYHGKNLGKHLITLAHQKLFELKVKKVILATNQSLFRAIKFYEKLGYRVEPIRAYCYSKDLTANE